MRTYSAKHVDKLWTQIRHITIVRLNTEVELRERREEIEGLRAKVVELETWVKDRLYNDECKRQGW